MAEVADVTVVIPSYGDREIWEPLALRATASVKAQTLMPAHWVVSNSADGLADSRNYGAECRETEWLIFLDADDELDPRYIESMMAAEGDIRRPATLGVVDGIEDVAPTMIPRKPLLDANFIVIGAMIRREAFFAVGGFRDLPILDDWDLFIRLWLEGAEIVDVPEAIYKIHVRPGSRNQQDPSTHGQTYSEIRRLYLNRSRNVGGLSSRQE